MTVQWKTREQCGLRAPNPGKLALRANGPKGGVLGVTVHWTGFASGPDPLATWRGIQRAEMEAEYGDLSYNAGVTDGGLILAGRDAKYVGAHAKAHANLANLSTYGVAYIGDRAPTPAGIQALRAYIYVTILSLRLGHTILLPGHQDWVPFGGIPTACPGTLEPVVRAIRLDIGAKAA